MKTMIEIWIKTKNEDYGWMLYALPGTRERAEAIVQAQRHRDPIHDYEVRELVVRAVGQ